MFLLSLVSLYGLLLIPVLYYLLPYVRNRSIRDIPGPPLAAFTNLWLLYQCRRGRRYLAVDAAHKKYGPLVRLQPHHVSIADPEAIGIVYSHTGGWLKSEYYDAFVSIRRGLFNTRDRAEHTRKRKTVSHTFSPKSVAQFEPYIRCNLTELVKQWDRMSREAAPADQGFVEMDCLQWFNYLAFDIIGDLAFGAPFGMLPAGADIAEVKLSAESETTHAPAIQVLNRRGEVSATLGCLPSLKPYASYLPDPFFRNGLKAVSNLAGIAVARVNARLDAQEKSDSREDSGRKDLLARLMEGRDEQGNKLGREELTAEALTQLIAGSDTTSNTSCAWLYWCLKTDGVYARLQEEMDNHIPAGTKVVEYNMVKDLPYLTATIQETLRIHSTSSLGLPRIVPPGPGVTISGHHFPVGTVLSVPAYTIHHSPSIWNSPPPPPPSKTSPTPPISTANPSFHPDNFNPDRWSPAHLTDAHKTAFIPFSTGPRACVGRNVAEMELKMICSTVALGYDFVLQDAQSRGGLQTREGFLRKPVKCLVGMRTRVRVRDIEGRRGSVWGGI